MRKLERIAAAAAKSSEAPKIGQWYAGQYGIHRLDLAPGYRVTIEFEKGAHKVTFAGDTMKARPANLDEAKVLGETFARQQLLKALGNLPSSVEVEGQRVMKTVYVNTGADGERFDQFVSFARKNLIPSLDVDQYWEAADE